MKSICLLVNVKQRMIVLLIVIGSLGLSQFGNAQVPADREWKNRTLFKKPLSDSGLINKSVQVVELKIPVGGIDTIPHKHPCELVGYIAEGEIETKMINSPAQRYKVGEVFYEFPSQLHEYIKNVSSNTPAKLILFYVFTTGAQLYIPFTEMQHMKHK